MILAWLLLLTGLTISAVAIYYSVVGLTAIFSAAVIPIIIMGSALEVGKLVCASWLKANWDRAPRFMKYYMITAVMVLMLITSMGIFGFLSKAHNDQNLVSGDVTSKIAIYDEKIKTEKENIEANRKALKQMDEGVDQVLGRSTDEKGADKAVALRRSQQKERARLQAEISQSQKSIAELNDARAPIAAEVRKVEAEVGPIKYIAKFIYGDQGADENFLEKAVTWIIILIVIVFDPLAVIMLLGAQMTFGWMRDEKENLEFQKELDKKREVAQALDAKEDIPYPTTTGFVAQELADVIPEAVVTEPEPSYEQDDGPLTEEQIEQVQETASKPVEYTPPSTPHWPFMSPGLSYTPTEEKEEKPKKPRKSRKKKVNADVESTQEQSTEASGGLEVSATAESIQEQDTISNSNITVIGPIETDQEQDIVGKTEIKPARDIEKEQQQAAVLEAIIQSSKPALDERPGDYVNLPADNAPSGTVGGALPGDEFYGKTDQEVKYQSRKRNAGGWFPEKKK